MSPVHQEHSSVRVGEELIRQLEHPDTAGETLEEAVDDNDDVGEVTMRQELSDTGLSHIVGEEPGVQVTGQVLSLEDHGGLDHVTTHWQRHVQEGRLVVECPVKL